MKEESKLAVLMRQHGPGYVMDALEELAELIICGVLGVDEEPRFTDRRQEVH
ncbi:MAG: hypothetical protein V2A77_10430 [Pseudomonadota bacterium]